MRSIEIVKFDCCFVLNRARIYFNMNIFATLLLLATFETVLLNIQMNLCMHKLKTIVLISYYLIPNKWRRDKFYKI